MRRRRHCRSLAVDVAFGAHMTRLFVSREQVNLGRFCENKCLAISRCRWQNGTRNLFFTVKIDRALFVIARCANLFKRRHHINKWHSNEGRSADRLSLTLQSADFRGSKWPRAGSLAEASVRLDYVEGNPYPADISARNLYEIERHQVRERGGRLSDCYTGMSKW